MKRILGIALTAAVAVVLTVASTRGQFIVSGPLNQQPDQQKLIGIVTDPSGAPVAGLQVTMVPQFASPARTDANGKYEISWRPPGPNFQIALSLMTRDTGRNLAVFQPIDQTATNVDLHLKPGVTLGVKVRDAAGNAITVASARATVMTQNSSSPLDAESLADQDGQIDFPALPAGARLRLDVQAAGYGTANVTAESADTTGKRFDFQPVTLQKADRQLSGQVLDLDGKPVSGANVSSSGDGQPGVSVRSDDQGKFRFNQLAPGPVTLFASGQNESGNVRANAGETNVTIRFGANAGFIGTPINQVYITGTVTDASGAPAVGVTVSMLPQRGVPVQTDTEGKYRLGYSAPAAGRRGGPVRLNQYMMARDSDHNLAVMEPLDDGATNLDLKLAKGVTLAVKVRDSQGKPISTALASVILYNGNNGFGMNTPYMNGTNPNQADANGQIELKGLPAGLRYALTIQATGYGTASLNSETWETGGPRLEFSPVALKTADQKLSGQVLDADGKPVFGVNVNASGTGQANTSAQSDSQGHFHFDRLVAGPVNLSASMVNNGTLQYGNAQATAGDTNVVIRLNNQNTQIINGVTFAAATGAAVPSVTTTGRVYDTNGAPAANVTVRMWPPFNGSTTSDAQGHYRLTWQPRPANLNPQYVPGIMAMDDEHNLAVGETIDNDTTNKDLRLKPALAITGTVVDENGAPLKSATAQLQFYSGTLVALNPIAPRVDSTGTFLFNTLPRGGQYGLIVTADGYPRKTVSIASSATETATLKLDPITLKPYSTPFAGQVLDETGAPVSGANVNIIEQNQTSRSVRTDSRGHFETKVGDGTYRVAITGPGGGGAQLVSLSGPNTNYVYRLTPNNNVGGFGAATAIQPLTISGIITDPTGAPAPNVALVSPAAAPAGLAGRGGVTAAAVLAAANAGGTTSGVHTDDSGHYTLTYLPPRVAARGNVPAPKVYLVARDTKNNLAGMMELDNKSTNVNLRLAPGLTVSGTVVDINSSKPLRNARLLSTNYVSLDNPLRFQAETISVDENGAFEITGLPRGITVGMRVEGGDADHGAVNRMVGPPETDAATVKLPAIGVRSFNLHLAGDIVTEDGNPVPNASFVVMGPGFPSPNFQADAKGHFDIKTSDGPNYVTITSPTRVPTITFQGGDTHIVIKVPNSAVRAPTVAATAGGRMPTSPAAGDDPGPIAAITGAGTPNIVVTGGGSSGGTVTTTLRSRPAAVIRIPRQPLASGNWLGWVTQHPILLGGLGMAQLVLLAGVAGGVLLFTRRSKT